MKKYSLQEWLCKLALPGILIGLFRPLPESAAMVRYLQVSTVNASKPFLAPGLNTSILPSRSTAVFPRLRPRLPMLSRLLMYPQLFTRRINIQVLIPNFQIKKFPNLSGRCTCWWTFPLPPFARDSGQNDNF